MDPTRQTFGCDPGTVARGSFGPLSLMNWRIRQAQSSDVTAMHRVRMSVEENRLTSVALSGHDYVVAIEETGRGWVGELAGEIVAFSVGNSANGSVWALFVDPRHEGKGYGRQLHDIMVAWLWEQGHQQLWLTTEPRTRAERFYRKAGWERVGTAPGEVRFELKGPNMQMEPTRDGLCDHGAPDTRLICDVMPHGWPDA